MYHPTFRSPNWADPLTMIQQLYLTVPLVYPCIRSQRGVPTITIFRFYGSTGYATDQDLRSPLDTDFTLIRVLRDPIRIVLVLVGPLYRRIISLRAVTRDPHVISLPVGCLSSV